jgi:hypothetical protein
MPDGHPWRVRKEPTPDERADAFRALVRSLDQLGGLVADSSIERGTRLRALEAVCRQAQQQLMALRQQLVAAGVAEATADTIARGLQRCMDARAAGNPADSFVPVAARVEHHPASVEQRARQPDPSRLPPENQAWTISSLLTRSSWTWVGRSLPPKTSRPQSSPLQAQALGQSVARIERGDAVILEGEELKKAIASRARDAE